MSAPANISALLSSVVFASCEIEDSGAASIDNTGSSDTSLPGDRVLSLGDCSFAVIAASAIAGKEDMPLLLLLLLLLLLSSDSGAGCVVMGT